MRYVVVVVRVFAWLLIAGSGAMAQTALQGQSGQDSEPPLISLPPDPVVEATSSGGAVVNYSASASDGVDGAVPVNCMPASGGVFAIGSHLVVCQAVDSRGNRASASFAVTVLAAGEADKAGAGESAERGSVTLNWSMPRSRQNGGALNVADLAGYEIYVIAEFSGADKRYDIDDPQLTTYTINGLPPDTYHISVSAVDRDGRKSTLSAIVTVTID